MRTIVQTSQFKTDLKKIAKSRKHNKNDFLAVLELLVNESPLPSKYRDHDLGEKWKHQRECHIKPDWLLIYRLENERLCLVRTGSHAELFVK
ncbi:MAG: type II toxin-antitoxin system YafQ family toxin [Proteobacteria bacterium]|nr:type II toxin-antitoxin system YafQ family toxin [Pseudomonadota bacterium]